MEVQQNDFIGAKSKMYSILDVNNYKKSVY